MLAQRVSRVPWLGGSPRGGGVSKNVSTTWVDSSKLARTPEDTDEAAIELNPKQLAPEVTRISELINRG